MSRAVTRLLPDPKFRITLVHHPASKAAATLAARIESHFFGGVFRDAEPGLGIDVSFRVAGRAANDARPPEIVLSSTRCDAIVVLADAPLIDDVLTGGIWDAYLADVVARTGTMDGASNIYVVALEPPAPVHPDLADLQDIRWFTWPEAGREERLLRELAHLFCVLLRPWVEAVEHDQPLPPAIDPDPDRVQVFISHSKADGEALAKRVRQHIFDVSQLQSFFDAKNIMAGTKWAEVLKTNIRNSILLVIHTDTFASREWCRLEVLTARECGVPVVVMHSVKDGEPRAFPYLGNVPVVVNATGDEARIAQSVGALLDQYLLSLYWRLHAKELRTLSRDADALVLPYAPDLLALVQRPKLPATVIYPDPPLGQAETDLLARLHPKVVLRTPMSLFVETR